MLWSSPGVMWSASRPHPPHPLACGSAWHRPLALALTLALRAGQSSGSRSLRSDVDQAMRVTPFSRCLRVRLGRSREPLRSGCPSGRRSGRIGVGGCGSWFVPVGVVYPVPESVDAGL